MARIQVPPAYFANIVGPDPTNPIWKAPGGPGLFEYIRAEYGSVTEGPPFVLVATRPAWLGPRPIAIPFTIVVPPP